MMVVKLNVLVRGKMCKTYQPWWVNFCQTEVKLESVSDDHPLTKWGGKMCPGSWIEFESEQDATMFLLRWS
jgi:hypothetical protein